MAYGHRYIFCLRPPALLARRIGALRDGLDPARTKVADERLHVTLGVTEDYPEYRPLLSARMIRIGHSVQAEPFRIRFDRLCGSGSVVALRPSRTAPGLRLLQRELDRRLSHCGLRRAKWNFNPHMTLLYGGGPAFLHPVSPFEWEATELVLVHSRLGETRHVELGRWPLERRQHELALSFIRPTGSGR